MCVGTVCDFLLKPLDCATLQRLGQHVYSCDNSSLMEPWLQPWWCWLVRRCPLWLSANLITLLGLLANIAATLTLLTISPHAADVLPRWSCVLFAVCLFIYQSMDAIDGKQARRTNSSSPLGELFDHGCDSVSVLCVSVAVCALLGLGEYPAALFSLVSTALIMFYQAHWQTFVTGTMRFGYVDVTEEQWTIITLFLASAVCGPDIWNTQIGNTGLKLKMVVFWLGLLPTLIHASGSIVHCYRFWRLSPDVVTVDGQLSGGEMASNVSNNVTPLTPASRYQTFCHYLSPAVPLLLLFTSAICQAFLLTDSMFTHFPVVFMAAVGVAVSKTTCRLVVAHMSKSSMRVLDSAMIPPLVLLLTDSIGGTSISLSVRFYLLCACVGIGILDFLLYWYAICGQICNYLGIKCFSLQSSSCSEKVPSSVSDSNTAAPDEAPLLTEQTMGRGRSYV